MFQSCDLEAAYVEQRVPTQLGGVATISLATGETYYFIDSVLGGCLDGRKIRVGIHTHTLTHTLTHTDTLTHSHTHLHQVPLTLHQIINNT